MPFYVSPEQAMRDKADYARKGIARGRSCVALQYAGGILMVAPNPSSALHKISEIYDRIAFAAVGRYNEYENLRKAGVTYADVTGYQFDRHDVTARGIANWYAQTLGTIFTESNKPFEVEIVVAEVGAQPGDDQIYRITFDGSVTDEPGFVAFGGQADQVSAALKERYSEGMSLAEAFSAALDALAAPANGERNEVATSLEVAVLERAREHRTFRRIRTARLEELIAESRAASASAAGSPDAATSADAGSPDAATSADAGSPDAATSADASTPDPAASTSPDAPTSGTASGSAASADSGSSTSPDSPIGPDSGSIDRGSGAGNPPL
jgi:proteasome alpha subunit